MADVDNTDRRITVLGQDVAVIKSQVADIRDAQRATNTKLDLISSYTRAEADERFADKQEVANIRWLVYTIIAGVIGFFFYVLQTKGI